MLQTVIQKYMGFFLLLYIGHHYVLNKWGEKICLFQKGLREFDWEEMQNNCLRQCRHLFMVSCSTVIRGVQVHTAVSAMTYALKNLQNEKIKQEKHQSQLQPDE